MYKIVAGLNKLSGKSCSFFHECSGLGIAKDPNSGDLSLTLPIKYKYIKPIVLRQSNKMWSFVSIDDHSKFLTNSNGEEFNIRYNYEGYEFVLRIVIDKDGALELVAGPCTLISPGDYLMGWYPKIEGRDPLFIYSNDGSRLIGRASLSNKSILNADTKTLKYKFLEGYVFSIPSKKNDAIQPCCQIQ